MAFNFFGLTNKGDNRKYNEDAVLGFVHENIMFLLVADGQGSDEAGQSAGRIAVEEIRKYIEQEYRAHMEASMEYILKTALYVAHRTLLGVRLGDTGRYQGLCTSLTLVAVSNQKKIWIAHVGNTKLFLLRDGSLIQMTTDHTVTQELLLQRKITPDEVPGHPERGILTRAIGVFDNVVSDIRAGQVQTGDILLLVSKGITDHLQEHEIASLVLQAGNNEKACEYLIQGSNERGGYDNLSALSTYIDF